MLLFKIINIFAEITTMRLSSFVSSSFLNNDIGTLKKKNGIIVCFSETSLMFLQDCKIVTDINLRDLYEKETSLA